MKARLREFRPEDLETLCQIDQACYEPEVAYSRRELQFYLRRPDADCIVAETSQGIAGFILTAQLGATGHIITIDVLAPWRRQGIGSALLFEAERRLGERGAKRTELETATNNDAGVAFWRKHGYRTRGLLPAYYPGGHDAYAMVKSLGEPEAPAKEI